MNTPTFRLLKHGALTISKGAQSAFDNWNESEYQAALADLDQIVSDTESLRRQAVQMRDDVAAAIEHQARLAT